MGLCASEGLCVFEGSSLVGVCTDEHAARRGYPSNHCILRLQLGTDDPNKIGQWYWNRQAAIKNGDYNHDLEVYSHPNFTNIHLHGMHVSPNGISDNVSRSCPPQQQLHYEYKIPIDHSPGTFWYHPHRDQASALQLASGMLGALVVEDDNQTLPPVLAAMDEVVLVLYEVRRKGPPNHTHGAHPA